MASAFSCTKIHIVGNITKVLFIIFNVAFMLVGLAILIAGAYLASISSDLSFITGSSTLTGALIIVVAGLFSMLLAIMGILAAIFQLRFILLLYALIIFIIIILEIAAGIYGFVRFRELLDGEIKEEFEMAVDAYRLANASDFNVVVVRATDAIQNVFDCCGVLGPEGWMNTTYLQSTKGLLPPSCCVNSASSCNITYNSHAIGCLNATRDFITSNVYAIGGIGVAFGIVEIFGILLAIALCVFIHVRIEL
jgi:hypothetical protein